MFKSNEKSPRSTTLLFIGLLLVATTLRAPITGVGPILETLKSNLGLSATMAGLLTALPLIAFGIIAPFAGKVSKVIGLERCLLISLIIVVFGVLLRSYGSISNLYLGTILLGIGIAFGNVLMPSLVKRDFPKQIPKITGKCGLAIGLSAAVTSTLAVPLMTIFNWKIALGSSVIFPLIALIIWSLFIKTTDEKVQQNFSYQQNTVWKSPLAWQVTIYMTINSILFYTMITWLPSILTNAGVSTIKAGSLHGLLQFASLVPGLLLGLIVSRLNDQRAVACILGLIQSLALLGFCFLPDEAPLWSFMFGLGTGGALILSLMMISLRTSNPQQAASLSGMAQCINFLLGAVGPILAGKVHEITENWVPILYVGIILAVLMAGFGILAGRHKTV
ncbi:MFS transporter [Acinetobacter oleivorans]|uniref:MFS transporter n=1 Tax=Acinetobacter TaxID=469 RepID=UPI000DD03996|nr:MFS transporter [Acinetobacter oleivorans]MDV7644939.1 MFS transporter [Acinetobacter baumannii]